jgi:tripartite-type tricarboxylate transporter receptor subunit TctC
VSALLGGYILADADGNAWAPLVNSGQFRFLITWGPTRTTKWPTVPILRETGVDLVVASPYGLAGSKGMDPTIAIKKGMEEPFLRRRDGQTRPDPLVPEQRGLS